MMNNNSDSDSDNRELVMDEAGVDGEETTEPPQRPEDDTEKEPTASTTPSSSSATGKNEKGEPKEAADLQEKHRLECLDNLEKIEKEFSDLKEKFFRDQMESLKAECEAIKLGSHERFLEKVKELEEKKGEKVWAAQQWREYQLANITNMFEAEKRQCEEEYKIEKRQLRDKMLHTIEDKIKKLEDEKSTMSLIVDGGDSRITRTLRRRKEPAARETQQQGQKRKLNPPLLHYTLKESEILEDLAIIRGSRDREAKHSRFS